MTTRLWPGSLSPADALRVARGGKEGLSAAWLPSLEAGPWELKEATSCRGSSPAGFRSLLTLLAQRPLSQASFPCQREGQCLVPTLHCPSRGWGRAR